MWMESYLATAEQMMFDGRVEEGLNVLDNLLYEEPGYGKLHNFLGWAYMYHGNDARKAEVHFTMSVRFAPDYAPAYLHMGTLLTQAGRYMEAIEYLREGLTKPDAIRSALLEAIGQVYELQGEYRRAVRAYKEAATASIVDFEVDRMLKAASRCRRKRFALLFAF